MIWSGFCNMCERCCLGTFFSTKKNVFPTKKLSSPFFFQQFSPILTWCCQKKFHKQTIKKKDGWNHHHSEALKGDLCSKFRGETFAKIKMSCHHLALYSREMIYTRFFLQNSRFFRSGQRVPIWKKITTCRTSRGFQQGFGSISDRPQV